MDLRKIIARITFQPKRGRTLMETETALRSLIGQLAYVREIEVTASCSFPALSVTASEPARGPCRACVNGFPLEMDACPTCGRTREPGKPERATGPMHRSDIDALADQWTNGNRETVIAALSVLDGPFAALAGAYLYHEMPDEYNRGVLARMLQRACEGR